MTQDPPMTQDRVRQILERVPGDVLANVEQADLRWQGLRNGKIPVSEVVTEANIPLAHSFDCDVVISGGTLGIFLAAALQQRGWRVTLIEKGKLRGRDQEWNISRRELDTFVELGLLGQAELEAAIATEYNPARISFHGGGEVWVKDVLNIGVDPVFLLEKLKEKFLAAGGELLEETAFAGATLYPDGIAIQSSDRLMNARLLLDGMGNFSPIVLQARQGKKPDGVCLVVGSCAKGYPHNETGDLLASFTAIEQQCQYFWEAFPARDGRTTYLFTYLDAHPQRPSLEFLLDEYFRLLPDYQNVELDKLSFERVLCGFFPAYRDRLLPLPWDRILPIGDSSGMQSPVSFGGFGSMVRHLKRLTLGIEAALQADALHRHDLALLQPYQPNIAATWLFQRAMSVGVEQDLEGDRINELLNAVFQEMESLGEGVLRPFLQDVVQFWGLTQTLALTGLRHPGKVLPVIPQVGIPALLDWLVHYGNLGLYTGLYALGKQLEPRAKHLPPLWHYRFYRWLDAWKYGSGGDYRE